MLEVETGRLEVVTSDARRDISEFNFSHSAYQLIRIRDSNKPLGQHYHVGKNETFCVLEGGGLIRVAQVNALGKIVGGVKCYVAEQGFVIQIPPWHTHRFDFEPGSVFICFSSAPFDPKDMVSCPIPGDSED